MKVEERKFDINLKFYFFLKYLTKINFSEKQVISILKISHKNKESSTSLIESLDSFTNTKTKNGVKQKTFFFANHRANKQQY